MSMLHSSVRVNDFVSCHLMWTCSSSVCACRKISSTCLRPASIAIASASAGLASFHMVGHRPAVPAHSFFLPVSAVLLRPLPDFRSIAFFFSSSRFLRTVNGREVNQKGIAYYNALIDGLLAAGITPAATLYHWDLPQALHESYGGWLNATIIYDFSFFARTCFENFGNKVPIWMTLNEPGQTAVQGYGTGNFAPRRCSDRSICSAGDSSTEPYVVCILVSS